MSGNCEYFKQENNQKIEGNCKITGLRCGLNYRYSFAIYEIPDRNNWKRCPAYNIPKDLAKKLIEAGTDRERSKLEEKL